MDALVDEALLDANKKLTEIDGIAVTTGPGLVGGLIVGLTYAKGLSISTGLPLISINHLEGHALTPMLTDNIEFPYILLLISGGHSQFLCVEGLGKYKRLGMPITLYAQQKSHLRVSMYSVPQRTETHGA